MKLYDESPQERSPVKGCVGVVSDRTIRKLKRYPKRYFVRAFEYGGSDIAGTLRRPN